MSRLLRRAAGATLAGLAGAAVGNRLLSGRAEPPASPLPGESRRYRWRGFDVAYAEAGDPENQDVLLLHGPNAAASGHEFRAVAEKLAADYHVLVPDLPGFGRSDRPVLSYSAALYTAFVEEFAADCTEDAVCVASSLSGAYAAAATRAGADFRELVLVCPTTTTMPGRRPWLRSLLRAPVVGQALCNLLVSKPSIRYFHDDHGFYDLANLSAEQVDYEWAIGHQPGARFAVASFLAGFLDLDEDLSDLLAAVDVPVTLVWGRESDLLPVAEGEALAERADARLVVFDRAKLVPHSEHPEAFADVVCERVRAAQSA